MTDDPRGAGMKLQTQQTKPPSINQPDTRTAEGSGDALRKQGNDTCVLGDRPGQPGYAMGSNKIDAGKPTTNKPVQGVQTMPQGFTPGSGKRPTGDPD